MAYKVTTQHEHYAAALSRWQRCRDCYEGGDAVKARGAEYLPSLDGMTAGEYAAYRLRADFYGATARTVDGLAGAVLRKEPAVKAPDAVVPHLSDVTSEGVPLGSFAKLLIEQDLCVGRAGILVDLPAIEQTEARPYWVAYRAEQIVNWRTAIRRGRKILKLVVLRETTTEPDGVDPFVSTSVVQYRVLELLPSANGTDVYTVTVWRKVKTSDGASEEFVPGEAITPKRRGATLDFLPFVFVGPSGITTDIEKPPLLDLADLNLSHYRSSADLERARFFTSSPTPYICGFNGAGVSMADPTNAEGRPASTPVYRIGSAVAWTFQSAETKVGMLEYTGQGLSALRDALKDKQEQMSVLGARLLEAPKSDAEAAATVRMRHAGDESVLKKLTTAVDQALTQALRWHVWWSGIDASQDEVAVTLNTDFLGVVISPELVSKLLLSLQAGEISSRTFYFNLTRAELTRPGVSFEQEHEEIDAESTDETSVDRTTTRTTQIDQRQPDRLVVDPGNVDGEDDGA